jgi:hypothetical protein
MEHALIGGKYHFPQPRWNGLCQAHSIVQTILILILSTQCHIFTK